VELPVIVFIQARIAESVNQLESRQGTGFYGLFIEPQELMLQPLFTAMETLLVGQSVSRILALADPDTFDSELVDSLASNVFVTRFTGGYAATTVRSFYTAPVDREWPALGAEFGANGGLSFFNTTDFTITSQQMLLQVSGNLYYYDMPVQAQNTGDAYNVPVGTGITTFINDPDAVSVTNLSSAIGGLDSQTNTQLLDQIPNAIAVRDLETGKGISAILQSTFPGIILGLQAIGFGDPEMMRDIVYNAHVGGNTDVYLNTGPFQTLSTTVTGLVFDTTRQVSRNVQQQMTAVDESDPTSYLGTPFIVPSTLSVTTNTIPTSAMFVTAAIPPVTGIDLRLHEWIELQVDETGIPTPIKISGAVVAQTQQYEIINAINAAIGFPLAASYGTNQISVTSPTTGPTSKLILTIPSGARTDGTLTLIPSAGSLGYPPIVTYTGEGPTAYSELIDYEVDYVNGNIWNLGGAILSGRTIVAPQTDGQIILGQPTLTTTVPGLFSLVQIGDEVLVTSSVGVPAGPYYVSAVVSETQIKLSGFNPTVSSSLVAYSVISQQVVVINYQYNPLSVDVGPYVLLADGVTRGIRPGRADYTITDVAFMKILTIEQADPTTGDGLGIFLETASGYGEGGYGVGGYGVGGGASDYQFVVNVPTARYSAWEDSMILFDASLFGNSYIITYYANPTILEIHEFCMSDLERVTGASVLAKNYIPGFVELPIVITRDPTDINTPTDAGLAALLVSQVNAVPSGVGLTAASLVTTLEEQGVSDVVLPFTMTMNVFCPDGTTSIYTSMDTLIVPQITLPIFTTNPTTSRIVKMYADDVTVTETP
jgi:hypothetical protein